MYQGPRRIRRWDTKVVLAQAPCEDGCPCRSSAAHPAPAHGGGVRGDRPLARPIGIRCCGHEAPATVGPAGAAPRSRAPFSVRGGGASCCSHRTPESCLGKSRGLGQSPSRRFHGHEFCGRANISLYKSVASHSWSSAGAVSGGRVFSPCHAGARRQPCAISPTDTINGATIADSDIMPCPNNIAPPHCHYLHR